MKQTYSGGCHCGAVRYEADVDLSQGTVRCNCSICSKARPWFTAIDSNAFRLLRGDDALSTYTFGAAQIQHKFCKHCGIKSFARIMMPDGVQVAIMVNCLENVPDSELAALPIVYVDGRNDNLEGPPAETRHL